MSENKSNDLKCKICGNSDMLVSISPVNIPFECKTQIFCPRCLIADQLTQFELTKINFPEEVKAIKELAKLILKRKKEKDAEFLQLAREVTAISSKETKS